jgi:hypothetical protein
MPGAHEHWQIPVCRSAVVVVEHADVIQQTVAVLEHQMPGADEHLQIPVCRSVVVVVEHADVIQQTVAVLSVVLCSGSAVTKCGSQHPKHQVLRTHFQFTDTINSLQHMIVQAIHLNCIAECGTRSEAGQEKTPSREQQQRRGRDQWWCREHCTPRHPEILRLHKQRDFPLFEFRIDGGGGLCMGQTVGYIFPRSA